MTIELLEGQSLVYVAFRGGDRLILVNHFVSWTGIEVVYGFRPLRSNRKTIFRLETRPPSFTAHALLLRLRLLVLLQLHQLVLHHLHQELRMRRRLRSVFYDLVHSLILRQLSKLFSFFVF